MSWTSWPPNAAMKDWACDRLGLAFIPPGQSPANHPSKQPEQLTHNAIRSQPRV
jgi:hypothetical protein